MIKTIRKISIIPIGLLVTAVFLSVIGLGVANRQKVVSGVSVDGVDVGGLKWEEARVKLEKETKGFLDERISVFANSKKIEASISNLGVDIDLDKSVDEAFRIGRGKDFLRNFIDQVVILANKKNIDMVLSFDDVKIDDRLKTFKGQEIELQNASIYFDDAANDFKVQYSRDGKMINREKFKKDVSILVQKLKIGEIVISFKTIKPALTNAEVVDLLPQARDLFGKFSNLNLIYGNNGSWPVDKKVIGGWIVIKNDSSDNLVVDFDKNKISDYLTSISQNINEEPMDAVLTYKNDKVQAFTLSRDGSYVDVAGSADKIFAALRDNQRQAVLEMDRVKAKIDTNEIDNLGLTSLLATGVSDFSGSPNNRMHNIKVGAAKFNGVLLKPKEDFSFVKTLGEVGAAEGYLPELVIKTNKTVPEYGGGLCQVSTTAFRAAVLAGLEIKERYPHSFPVKYYNPQGFDAAIYPPSPDLKFVNDTPNNLLIQTKVKGSKLYFEFYGTDDGRKVVLTGPEEYDKNPDGSMKTKLTRELFDKDGNLVRTTVFRSNYKSPNLYPVIKNPLE